MRGDQQSGVIRVHRVAGKHVEQVADVFAHLVIAGNEAEILIQSRGLGVVVAGAKVRVTTQAVTVIAHDHRKLAMSLQADQAVNDVHASLFELASPVDVVLLVETSLDLDESKYLLTHLCGIDECLGDRRVT